ncbi:flavin-dependent pyridine nucleotide oxidoreductase (homolog to coenzyme A disulfide reductase) (plasmid) [Natrialba magadii ATCC 43099]|uniref:FAD-dependent pyridine nucleotide-disulfide oxidoreductase n=1 Tax=Natrialba magadii (strain ATCC 43099 / DSM 3394 / CCM 3739 / CIP 104546 / IAM 13178 / JCM 8861 / NBRC 102185 / NCIMB 2190 / MS3) TaxID=547559 RepID=D3T109_NATMM|nr:FAD-dependent oxidoreductase [Natrialba magadii]ADD07268.1 flavin-dependent pyridine nucleotide oxidoreductase (homolog to coenzyme A disulfide reductase) [Natrialba magadii ATCC 43099]ELY34377.1 FAD-dependent pyridine nucleotide-disulfide oxidoreductase [Natrialba magadii ATCC 43099]
MTDPFVVIGGDAAGMSAASKAKRDDPSREVIVFEKGSWVSYAACGMPYYVKGSVDELDDLVAMTPETFREERDIDLRTGHEVVSINRGEQTVTVATGDEQFEQPYGDLLIGTGAQAIVPPFDGFDRDGVFTLRGMDEADAIERYVDTQEPATAAIVGGGYVGIEMAEALTEHGIDVTIFEMLPRTLQPFGEEAARIVEGHLRDQGVDLQLETAVQGFSGGEAVDAVEVEGDEDPVPADIVIVGVGVAPNVELAEDAGIELGPTGAIATDEFGRTNDESVYAAGDCAEATNVVTGEPDHVPLALTANRAGRAIGATVAGEPAQIGKTAGTAIVKAFELGAARTGVLDAERAREAGFDPVSVTIDAPTRPHYYPGATELTVTLVADRESERVLGASIVGRKGTKRIDTVATALHASLTVTELQNLDLAYAPPFSPVWDPVLTAAKVLSGKLEG